MGHLRALTVDQQVGLLFVILFGALVVVSAVSGLVMLRRSDQEGSHWHQRVKAELRAIWAGAIVFWLAWVSGAIGATLLFAVFSFFALREFITLAHTRRSDHRSLILAFFVVLPAQYLLVGFRTFDLFTVFIPVYVFIAIPVISALAGDPERFLERNAKIQWGVMVCIYGLSHAPALLLLEFKNYEGRGAFLVFFLVVVVATAQRTQEGAARWLRRRPVARHIDRSFSYRAWAIGATTAAIVGAALYWTTPFKAGQALAMAFIAAGAGSFGDFVMKALKKDAGVPSWGNRSAITGAVGLLDRVAPLCFAAPVFFHSVRWYFQFRG
ncbi:MULTISPECIES: phosphatidate cytidylyltransferase [Rubrivivax]|uniref:Phosphatidate cytidylyltransferase n=1 Tax=Rubrivivax benzoatilyticus TaxID=316997 RepID=A0ABX0HTU4_9BURK|nr:MULTISPECIES: phosphatidate cytidylyltransferase [Rubrivivax]MCD0418774.1 phosphatidate cytidylyltransferase [Rubrivivax sp. JA1024]MCC9598760.1 phosphatidate cytidylyltransferase [Rubrivivax sp. JA1055]MCC9648460.1 phosphatidate cytidylyltransferase [Rubrivivax sp. JA1029]NHK97182.1 phosphatidate cytidylyltransferase [Rubrivivax benzoatilyticus]NHL23123.1 phosphatidate cytidylyltransferase [Rubrivivax benzoatilyticus]